MFDIGFSELVLIGVIALIVIGPERLPEVARTVGKYVGRMRRFVNKVRDDIESEISQEELREAIKRHADLDDIKKIINDSRYTIENEVAETRQHVVKAQDDDPRGDFSQEDLLKEQDGEFENENYGLTDHRDYGANEIENLSNTRQAEETSPAQQIKQTTSVNKHRQASAADEAVTATAETQAETAAKTTSKAKKKTTKRKRTQTEASSGDNSEQDSTQPQTETEAKTASKPKKKATKSKRTQVEASSADNSEQDD